MLRQPIVCVLGHVDHGKTTLLDKIRRTTVAAKEAGGITQSIGTTEIPLNTIKKVCGSLLSKFKTKITIPGLLFVDTPGHEAFTSLRKRGGSCADIAVLIVDINEGFQPQTTESIEFLKQFKTPFIVAANKIDRISGWIVNEDSAFTESFQKQPGFVKEELENKIYKLVGQLSEHGFESERFDRIADFTKYVSIVPCSGLTGEGIPELLMLLTGLAQEFLKERIEVKGKTGVGSILEVKEVKGLGQTIDVILYDGEMRKGDWLVIGAKEPIVTRIKALLKPPTLREMRVEKQFEHFDVVTAACGVKVSAPGLENVVAGSSVLSVHSEADVEKAKNELKRDVELVEFEKSNNGVLIKADTLGSLEALIHILKQKNIEIRKAEVGDVHRSDILGITETAKRVILAFNVKTDPDAMEEAKSRKVNIFSSDVIYKLIEDYEEWEEKERERIKQEKLSSITMPGSIVLLKGFIFRTSNPAVVGVEVLSGVVKPGVKLIKNGKEVGIVKEIQTEGQVSEKAVAGERVALSIEGGVVGRNIKEGDTLYVKITENDLKVLEELGMEESKLAREILENQNN